MNKSKKVEKAPEKPVIEVLKEDYFLAFTNGSLWEGNNTIRAKCMYKKDYLVDGKAQSLVEEVKEAVCGFGFTQNEAAKDFISRNTTELLNKVFDIK